MMIGENDRSVESNRTARRLMEEKGIRSELIVYPELGHAFPPDPEGEIRKALEWMDGKGR
jgi:acetyl esterase/lipase